MTSQPIDNFWISLPWKMLQKTNKECQKMVKKGNKFTNHVVAVVNFYMKRQILQKKLQEVI